MCSFSSLDHLGEAHSKAQSHLLFSWLIWNVSSPCVLLSCSLSGWRVAVLHPQLDHKYFVCGDHDPHVFLSTVALPCVLSAVGLSHSLVNFDVLILLRSPSGQCQTFGL